MAKSAKMRGKQQRANSAKRIGPYRKLLNEERQGNGHKYRYRTIIVSVTPKTEAEDEQVLDLLNWFYSLMTIYKKLMAGLTECYTVRSNKPLLLPHPLALSLDEMRVLRPPLGKPRGASDRYWWHRVPAVCDTLQRIRFRLPHDDMRQFAPSIRIPANAEDVYFIVRRPRSLAKYIQELLQQILRRLDKYEVSYKEEILKESPSDTICRCMISLSNKKLCMDSEMFDCLWPFFMATFNKPSGERSVRVSLNQFEARSTKQAIKKRQVKAKKTTIKIDYPSEECHMELKVVLDDKKPDHDEIHIFHTEPDKDLLPPIFVPRDTMAILLQALFGTVDIEAHEIDNRLTTKKHLEVNYDTIQKVLTDMKIIVSSSSKDPLIIAKQKGNARTRMSRLRKSVRFKDNVGLFKDAPRKGPIKWVSTIPARRYYRHFKNIEPYTSASRQDEYTNPEK